MLQSYALQVPTALQITREGVPLNMYTLQGQRNRMFTAIQHTPNLLSMNHSMTLLNPIETQRYFSLRLLIVIWSLLLIIRKIILYDMQFRARNPWWGDAGSDSLIASGYSVSPVSKCCFMPPTRRCLQFWGSSLRIIISQTKNSKQQ